jgi:GT2 family glycosyltransferase
MPCVGSVLLYEEGIDPKRIIVVDDGVGDECRKAMPIVTWVMGEKPFIFSRNANAGIRQAEGDVVLLNDDAILQTKGGFTTLAKASYQHVEYGLLSATSNVIGNQNQFPRGVGLRDEPRVLAFVCVYIPKRTVDAIGFLDERFTQYGWEDNDYCRRVLNAGLRLGVHDGCYVDHGKLKSSYRGDPLSAGKLDGGWEIYRDKWGIA